MHWILSLFSLSLLAVFTSQSLVDLADILMVLTALFVSFKNQEIKILFTSFKPAWIWPAWLGVIVISYLVNAETINEEVLVDFLELRWIVTFLAAIYLVGRLKDQSKLIQIWGLILIVLNTVALVLFVNDQHWRASGVLGAVMAFSHNIAPIFCLYLVYLFLHWKSLSKNQKMLTLITVVTSGLLTLLTFTRGVWIGSFVGVMTALFIWNKKVAAGFLTAAILLGVTLVIFNPRVNARVLGKTDSETQSNDERIALWRANSRIIQESPFFGVGLGQNKFHLRKYFDEFGLSSKQRVSHAHNQYLQMWAGTGTLGFLFFLAFYWLILKYAYQGYQKAQNESQAWQLGLLAALICFMVGSLTESNFNIAKNRYLFLILAGFAVAQSLRSNKKV